MLQSKLPDTPTTIFTVMSQLAVKHNAINLGQGFPDFAMSKELTDLVNVAMQQGFNQYAHTNGLPQLRKKLCEKANRLYGAELNEEENLVITPGATYALYTALTSLLHPGDEVIVFEPAYDSYTPNIIINAAVPVYFSLQFPNFSYPWEAVKKAINPRTKAIIINSPHNPTGRIITDEDIAVLHGLLAQHPQLVIISDEVYEHLVFDNRKHLSVLAFPELLKRSIACYSFGKTYHCTGWKMGYAAGAKHLMDEFKKVHQYNAFSVSTPMQWAIAEYLENADAWKQLGAEMQARRDLFQELMLQTPFRALPSAGSYFQCYSYEAISNLSERDFAVWLTEAYGVAAIPVSSFYHNGADHQIVRFCFAKKETTLRAAAQRLAAVQAKPHPIPHGTTIE